MQNGVRRVHRLGGAFREHRARSGEYAITCNTLCSRALPRPPQARMRFGISLTPNPGKGIATEAEELVDFRVGELRLHRIWATCLPRESCIGVRAGESGYEKGGFPRQEPEDPRSVEEQFPVRRARGRMELRRLEVGARIRLSCRLTPTG